MLSTGDVQGGLRKLETLLRAIKYPGQVDYDSLSKGDPSAFLPILSFTFTSFSPPFAEQLMAIGLELTGKTDLRFTDTLYKVLRDIFHYKPVLTKQQFLQWGFSQRKISVLCDIINLVLQKHNQLKKPRVRCPTSHKESKREAHPSSADAETMDSSRIISKWIKRQQVSQKPFVVNHRENPSSFPAISSHTEAFPSHKVTWASQHEVYSCSSSENEITELTDEEEEDKDKENPSKLEGRLSAIEAQLETLLSGLDRIRILEKRLEESERWRNTDQNEGQVITICRESWENLMSRVLLLETKLELSNIQVNTAPPPSTTLQPSADVSKGDLKDRLESITNMLKTTSDLLKNTESSTSPSI